MPPPSLSLNQCCRPGFGPSEAIIDAVCQRMREIQFSWIAHTTCSASLTSQPNPQLTLRPSDYYMPANSGHSPPLLSKQKTLNLFYFGTEK